MVSDSEIKSKIYSQKNIISLKRKALGTDSFDDELSIIHHPEVSTPRKRSVLPKFVSKEIEQLKESK